MIQFVLYKISFIQRSFMNHLTSVEIYIWNYLEENKAKIIQMTVAQIAESAHVSPSSIIRTLKKKNFWQRMML